MDIHNAVLDEVLNDSLPSSLRSLAQFERLIELLQIARSTPSEKAKKNLVVKTKWMATMAFLRAQKKHGFTNKQANEFVPDYERQTLDVAAANS